MKKLIVRPLGRRISRQGAECLKQGRRILKRIKEVDESMAIIARQMKRQIEWRVGLAKAVTHALRGRHRS